jgi:hypothetical protein
MGRTMVGGLTAVALAVALPLAAATPRNRSDRDWVPQENRGPVPPAGGQCSTPPPVIGTTPFTDSGNTCTPGTPNAVNTYDGACGLALPFPYPGAEHIYRLTLGTTNNVGFSLSLTGSTGDLALFLVNNAACGTGTGCVANSQDAAGPGAGPEVISAAARPAGTYFLYIDSYYAIGNPAACGTYALNVTGPLPAELLQFDVN